MRHKRWLLLLLPLLLLPVVVWAGPAEDPAARYAGEAAAWTPYADAVAAWALAHAGDGDHHTGSARFDGEWDMGACEMAVMGLGQVVLRFPAYKARYQPGAKACMDWLLTAEAHEFGRAAWGNDALLALDGPNAAEGRDAWLGYLAMGFGMYRLAFDPTYEAVLHDKMMGVMEARLSPPYSLYQTYPGETYPVDQATTVGALALAQKVGGHRRHQGAIEAWIAWAEAEVVDPATGLLPQAMAPASGRITVGPRGSGTGLAAYALSFVETEAGSRHPMSGQLYAAMVRSLLDQPWGVAGMREYPRGVSGLPDIDSGPIVLGLGMSSTGFALASARIHQDEATWRLLAATTQRFGLPLSREDGVWYSTGGAIGNCILLAMFTAGS